LRSFAVGVLGGLPAADGLAPVCAYSCDVALGGPDLTIVVGFDGSPERLVRKSADCAATIAALGFRAHVAGVLDAHVVPQ
jgi:hypothetical protein